MLKGGLWELEDRNDVIRKLLTQLDHHSTGEHNHAQRVAVYSVATAYQLGLRDEQLLEVRYAALLHDVGKVRVDASVLGKMGTLSDEEFVALRAHAELALEIVGGIDFLQPCLPTIRHHHERWDGEGYPDGLAGEDIPLGARIVSVAESFDVMVHSPEWKASVSSEDAKTELKALSGKSYDEAVVKAFCEIESLIQPIE